MFLVKILFKSIFYSLLCSLCIGSNHVFVYASQPVLTELMYAVLQEDITKVSELVQDKVEINSKNSHGTTALMLSLIKGNTDIMQVLINNGADVNARMDNGLTVLMLATNYAKPECIQILLDNGADIDATVGKHGMTAFMFSALYGDVNVSKVFIEYLLQRYTE